MSTSLNGTTPQATYVGLLKFGDSSIISATPKVVSDGLGNDSVLFLGSANVGINSNSTASLLFVKGTGGTSATKAFRAENSSATSFLELRDDGRVTLSNAQQYVDGNGAKFYQVASANGSGRVNLDGGIVDIYDSSGVLNTAFRSTFIGMLRATKIGDVAAPNASSILELSSTTLGFLPPRMTTAQINAIASPAVGLIVFNTTLNNICFYDGAWQKLSTFAAM